MVERKTVVLGVLLLGGAAIILSTFLTIDTPGRTPTGSSPEQEQRKVYKAQVAYTVSNPSFSASEIQDVSVSGFQVEEVIYVSPNGGALSFLSDDLRLTRSVTCDGEPVFSDQSTFTVTETQSVDQQEEIRNMMEGSSCEVFLILVEGGEVVDRHTEQFTVPGGT